MTYKFHPDLSFAADIYWQQSSTSNEPLRVTAPGDLTNEGDGWLWAGVPRERPKSAPGLRRQNFWFGCYSKDGKYCYQIRGRTPGSLEIVVTRQLDVSRNGYLGMYPLPSALDVVSPLAIIRGLEHMAVEYPIAFWTVNGFDTENLKIGQTTWNITLVSPNGREVKRSVEDGWCYLNDSKGESVAFGIEVNEILDNGPRYGAR